MLITSEYEERATVANSGSETEADEAQRCDADCCRHYTEHITDSHHLNHSASSPDSHQYTILHRPTLKKYKKMRED